MNISSILQLLTYTVPALLVTGLSYVYFNQILKNQNRKDKALLNHLEKPTVDTLALRLQAYERFTILIDRIDLQKIILRIPPSSPYKEDYQLLLIQHIQQEFEYNTAQQIYISEGLWEIITQTKNMLLTIIQQSSTLLQSGKATDLQTVLIQESANYSVHIKTCLSAIKAEAQSYL